MDIYELRRTRVVKISPGKYRVLLDGVQQNGTFSYQDARLRALELALNEQENLILQLAEEIVHLLKNC